MNFILTFLLTFCVTFILSNSVSAQKKSSANEFAATITPKSLK